MIEFRCSNQQCDFTKKLGDDLIGKKAKCPKCKTVTKVVDNKVVIELADDSLDPVFDTTKTFGYKGDFLGMSTGQFLTRHKDDSAEEFSFVSSHQVELDQYSKYGFEDWTNNEKRIQSFSARGSRLTLVNVPLRHGVFRFLDDRLALIHLEVAAGADPIGIFTGLTEALGPSDDSRVIVDNIAIKSWEKPEGHLSFVEFYSEGEQNIRYINQLLLPESNKVSKFHNASDASSDM